MIGFSVRNLKVFFKDRAAVFFSLMAVFIIIGLYALFLGDVWVSGFEGMSGVRFLMDSWIMAGLLAVTSMTTTMGAFGIMVEDKANKITKDFTASPIKNSSIVSGYIFSGVIVGIVMSLLALVLTEIYMVINGGMLLSPLAALKVLGLIVITTITNTSIVLFVVSFFKSSNAFATASSIIGTLIGFITGIYLPVGSLPEGVQLIVKCFPISHAAALFRQVMMEEPMSVTFAGAPANAVAEFEQTMGVTYEFGGAVLSPLWSVLILAATALIFFGLSMLNLSRKSK